MKQPRMFTNPRQRGASRAAPLPANKYIGEILAGRDPEEIWAEILARNERARESEKNGN